jgi:hypothetical protein
VTVAAPEELVGDARDRYLAENRLDMKGYDAPQFVVPVGPIKLRFPNPGLLRYHDLHHVVTGFGTDLLGEAEISCFELRAGGANALVLLLCVGSILIASVLAPRRLLRAWRRSRGCRGLYRKTFAYDELIAMTVGELRDQLGVPRGGLAGP